MNANIIKKANDILKSEINVVFAVLDENGYPSASTVSIVGEKNIYRISFSTNVSGNKINRLKKSGKASVCIQTKEGANVTLVGDAVVITSQEVKTAKWEDWFINHFAGGETDPEYCIVEFTTKRVSLWIDREVSEFKIDDINEPQSRCGLLCNSCTFKEPCNCGGCIETNGHPFHGECHIAACCQDKGFTHCGECPEVPCKELYDYSYSDTEHGDKPAGARVEMCKRWSK